MELILPTGVYTVQAKASHWLRGEGIVLTSAPWIFAAPTGADKVTVYWDPVPNATGYRVRWGTASGVYPHVSSVQPADARMLSIIGLTSEQEYYFVVESERNGVWSVPSEEDSAIPHVGAIPWDSGDTTLIFQRIQQTINSVAGNNVLILSPNNLIYSYAGVQQPSAFYARDEQGIVPAQFPDVLIPLTNTMPESLESTSTGPYRRVRTRQGQSYTGVRSQFWIPSTFGPRYPYIQITIAPQSIPATREDPSSYGDTPCMYFGIAYGSTDIEGGLMFHPAGRMGLPYPRWQPYLVVRQQGAAGPFRGVCFDFLNAPMHIRVDDHIARGGLPVTVELLAYPRKRFVLLRATAFDPESGNTLSAMELVSTARIGTNVLSYRIRRVHSIAQQREKVRREGYKRTGSFVGNMGVGYDPIEGSDLSPFAELLQEPYTPGQQGNWWTPALTDQSGAFPAFGVVNWNELGSSYFKEFVWIDLR